MEFFAAGSVSESIGFVDGWEADGVLVGVERVVLSPGKLDSALTSMRYRRKKLTIPIVTSVSCMV